MKIEIVRKRIKNLYIRVDETGTVKISAPLKTPDFVIFELVEKKRAKLQEIIEKRKASLIDFSNSDTIPYLGKTIKVKKIKSDKDFIVFKKNQLHLYLKEFKKAKIEKLIFKWYFQEAEKVIKHLISKFSPLINKEINRITIKKMKTRWGSCNKRKGYLNFNVKLIQKPLKGVEYVVVHELVHLIYANHGREFYNTLGSILPDWKNARETLYQT